MYRFSLLIVLHEAEGKTKWSVSERPERILILKGREDSWRILIDLNSNGKYTDQLSVAIYNKGLPSPELCQNSAPSLGPTVIIIPLCT